MSRGFIYVTDAGPFTIVEQDGLFVPYFDGVALGAYVGPEFAVDDLADGHAIPHPSGIDTHRLGIPNDLAKWKFFVESALVH